MKRIKKHTTCSKTRHRACTYYTDSREKEKRKKINVKKNKKVRERRHKKRMNKEKSKKGINRTALRIALRKRDRERERGRSVIYTFPSSGDIYACPQIATAQTSLEGSKVHGPCPSTNWSTEKPPENFAEMLISLKLLSIIKDVRVCTNTMKLLHLYFCRVYKNNLRLVVRSFLASNFIMSDASPCRQTLKYYQQKLSSRRYDCSFDRLVYILLFSHS
jgi:hypothetical protein